MGKIDTIFRNLNRRTGLDRQNNKVTCPNCGWGLNDDWFIDALSDATPFYKHTTTGTDTNGKPVTVTTYKNYQQYDGQPPAYLVLEDRCLNEWKNEDGEYIECDETITVKLYLLGAEAE